VADLSKLKRIVDIEYNDITRDSSIHHDKPESVHERWFDSGYLVFKEDTGSFLISLGAKADRWGYISP
jgi:hypothetical protein